MNSLLKGLGSLLGGTFVLGLFLLNTFGSIVGAVWLFVAGEWRLVVGTFLISLFVPALYSLITFPALGVAFLTVNAVEKGKVIKAGLWGLFAVLYQNVVMGFWVYMVFCFFANQHYTGNFVPLLLWGYGIATGPIFYMASKEPPSDDNLGTTLGCLLAMCIYLCMTVCWIIGVSLPMLLTILVLIVCIFSLFSATIAVLLAKEQTSY